MSDNKQHPPPIDPRQTTFAFANEQVRREWQAAKRDPFEPQESDRFPPVKR